MGAAIRYWLEKLDRSQADLVHALNEARRERHRIVHGRGRLRLVQPKTISMIARGFHTQTRLLSEIADALDVPVGRPDPRDAAVG